MPYLFKQIKILLIFSIILTLNSCGIYKYSDARKNPTNANERIQKNMDEGKGFRLGSIGKKSNTFQFASSNPLWRASLEIIDFMPLSNADYAGGLIITDWYSEGNPDEAVKITIKFLSNEIRVDSLSIDIRKKNCNQKKATSSLLDSRPSA